MNFTTQDYKEFYNNIILLYKTNPNQRNLDIQRSNKEYAFLLTQIYSQSNGCSVLDADTKVSDLRDIKSKMGEKFYDFDVVQKASCSINAIFHPISGSQGVLSVAQIIRESVTGLSRIGQESAMGYALLGGVKGVSDLFVIKVPSERSKGQDLYTERFVTEFGTNYMRKIGVPNFAVTYGHFLCSRPIIDTDTRKVLEYCSPLSNEKVPYLVYENIGNSISAESYVQRASVNQFLSMYLQCMFAIDIASRKIGFTHQDLHPGNVLMREIQGQARGERFQIPYEKENGGFIYVKADSVATIIDFGLSTIQYPNQFTGNVENLNSAVHGSIEQGPIQYGRYSDIVWPLHDAYKFLLFLALYTRESKNVQVFNKIQQVFRFFSSEDINVAINSQFDLRYTLPYTEKTKNYTVRDLINFCIKECGGNAVVSGSRDNGKVLECEVCHKLSIQDKKRKINIPQSMLELFDVLPYIEKKYGNASLKAVIQAFPYLEARMQFVERLDTLIEETKNIIHTVDRPNLAEMQLFNIETLSMIQSNNTSLFSIINNIESIVTNITVGNWNAELFQDEPLKEYLTELMNNLIYFKNQFCFLLNLAIQNYNIIKEQLQSPQAQEIIRKDSRLFWYIDSAEKITGLKHEACENPEVLVPDQFVFAANSKSESSMNGSMNKRNPVQEHFDRRGRIYSKYM